MQKNKEQRDKAREVSLVKRDTHILEKEILQLQSKPARSSDEDKELSKLLSEVKKIKQAKEEYLSKHPEHRQFVYPREAESAADKSKSSEGQKGRTSKQTPLRDPKRSIYYDAVFNPFGAPPPGMPYMEKSDEQWKEEQRNSFKETLGSDEMNESSDGNIDEDIGGDDIDESSDDDIAMPSGPPPLPLSAEPAASQEAIDESEDTSEDEDGIVMPKGPPPAPPSAPKAMLQASPAPLPPRPRPPISSWQPPLPPTPSTIIQQAAHTYARPIHHASASSVNASNKSAQVGQTKPTMPSAPPPVTPAPARPSVVSSTVITSAPVLRDLKKEATAFVPTALRKKQAAQR